MDRWVLALSMLSVPFTLTHAFEDFSEGIEQTRFGLALHPAAFLLSLAYAAQIAAAALAARRQTSGYWLNLILAVGWLIAAAADHLGERDARTPELCARLSTPPRGGCVPVMSTVEGVMRTVSPPIV